MRFVAPISGIVATLLAVVLATAAEEGKKPLRRPLARIAALREARPADEKEIHQSVEAFVKAYNNHDAAAIASLFTPDGSTVSEDGIVAKGRQAIEQLFAGVFKEHPKTALENTVESVRFVSLTEAIETGATTTTYEKDSAPEKGRYQVVHTKKDGKWQMATATDLPEDSWTGEEPLSHLEGLIGNWIDESPDAVVLTSYDWSENHRFILGSFTIQIAGKPAMTGMHRIGWDPLKKTLRSWIFDSEGGCAEGVWTHDAEGERWMSKMTGFTPSGKAASSTHIVQFEGKDRMSLQITDRVVDGEKLPDGQKILVVRRAPTPK